MAEGLVVAGMTGVEVIKARGKPDRVCRILTARSVIELWTYGTTEESPLVVRLVRSGNRKFSVVTDEKRVRQTVGLRIAEPDSSAGSESGESRSSEPEPK